MATTKSGQGHDAEYRKVMDANIAVHGQIAADYKKHEPHFRAENVTKVRATLARLVAETSATKLLDLGCGTGFIIEIAKTLVREIHGVDITQRMLDEVDLSGSARITLWCQDTASFERDPGTFDLVTSYSFLHHLYDIRPSLRTAYRALRPGGIYYADLDPNRAFWAGLSSIQSPERVDPIVRLEIEKTRSKDHEVAATLGIDKELLDQAEYGKNIRGGFDEDELVALLHDVGFNKVDVSYYWFIGQAHLINDERYSRADQILLSDRIDQVLKRALPLSRNMFKYLGFIAVK
jgi:ubiquinone/menaquinone biosynthesis C-methylase UbiE